MLLHTVSFFVCFKNHNIKSLKFILYNITLSQCAQVESNKSLGNRDRTFAGRQSMVRRSIITKAGNPTKQGPLSIIFKKLQKHLQRKLRDNVEQVHNQLEVWTIQYCLLIELCRGPFLLNLYDPRILYLFMIHLHHYFDNHVYLSSVRPSSGVHHKTFQSCHICISADKNVLPRRLISLT